MKIRLIAAAVLGFTVSSTLLAQDLTALTNDTEKLSYSIGADLGKNFKQQGIEISPNAMAKGLQDGINGGQLLLTEPQMKEVLNKFQHDLVTKRQAEFTKIADDNKTKGEQFLNQNKTQAGIVSLASGLQYKILTPGTGIKPMKDDTVTV